MDEQILISMIKEGNGAAFKQLFDRYYSILCGFANQILHDTALSESITDDAIFYLWEHRNTIEIKTSVRSYLFQTVRNRSINELNARKRRMERTATSIPVGENAELLSAIFRDDSHPLGMLIERELEEQIYAAVEQLPDECRRVFKMSRFEDKRHKEIATELNISVNTVKYHIKNALAHLHKRLESYLKWIILLFFMDL